MPYPALLPSLLHGARRSPSVLRLLAACVAAVSLSATEAGAEVGVVTGDPQSLPPARRAALLAVEAALEDYGIPYNRVEETTLSERTLRGFELIVLPLSRVTQGEALRTFAQRGGRWVAYQATGDPVIHTLMGLQVAAPLDNLPTALIPEPRPGTPARVVLAAGSGSILPLRASDPSFEAGRWDRTGGEVSALVRGPHGYFANFAPSAAAGQASLLTAMLGDLEPRLWELMLRHARRRASDGVGAAAVRWTYSRHQPGWTEDQRAALERALRQQRDQLPDERLGPLEISSNRRLAAERVNTARELTAQSLQLSYRMAVSRKGELRGLWVQAGNTTDWETVMRRARDAGLNTVFVQVGAGEVAELKPAVEIGHKYGLAVHAVRTDFDVANASPDVFQKLVAEDRLTRAPDGRQATFLNPGDPRNQELVLQGALDAVKGYDVDGFHFGALRYADSSLIEGDYGAVSRREFEKASGKPVQKWPDEVVSGARKREYDDWQRENLNRLVQRCHGELKKLKPYVHVSVTAGPRPRQARSIWKQDWPQWIDKGWVDFVVPLDAVTDAERLAMLVDGQVSTARGKAPVVAALSTTLTEKPLDLVRQVEIAREQGSDGFVLLPAPLIELEPHLLALRAGATNEGTWPGYLAPEIEWTLPPLIERKDAPIAFPIGERVPFEAKLLSNSPTRVAVRGGDAELRLEDLEGRLLLPLGTMNNFNVRRVRFEAPAGQFRPVLRGSLSYADGSVRPFVVRGPVCEGLPNEDFSALRAREAPPVVAGDGRRVAVYAGGTGGPVLLQTLGGTNGIRAFPLHRFKPDHLATAQVLVLTELEDVAELNTQADQALREWVAAGGILLLTHDAIGARTHPRLFPEVGSASTWAEAATFELAEAVGDRKAGAAFTPTSSGYWRIRPGEGVQILAREAGMGGAPVLVSGRVGKGRVILYGAAPGHGGREVGESEAAILRLLVRSSTTQ